MRWDGEKWELKQNRDPVCGQGNAHKKSEMKQKGVQTDASARDLVCRMQLVEHQVKKVSASGHQSNPVKRSSCQSPKFQKEMLTTSQSS